MFKSRKKVFFNYLLVFSSTFAFIFTVIFLRKYGYIKEFKLPEKDVKNPNISWQKTDVKIKKADIKDKIIYSQDKKLFAFDYFNNTPIELISNSIVEYPGILKDGRIYFWQENQGLYNTLFVQNGSNFEKLEVPIEEGDFGSQNSKVSLISPDGTFLSFLSSRDTNNNYQNNSVYIYNLKNFNLNKVTDNNLMTVNHLFISDNSNLIGFTYNFLDSLNPSKTFSLGIIMGQNTPNLFSKIEIKDNKVSFSSDNKKVLLESSDGFQIFNLEIGKLDEKLEGFDFEKIKSKTIILSKKTNNNSNLDLCEDLQDLKDFYIYNFKDNKLEQLYAFEDRNYTLDFLDINSQATKALVYFSDLNNCQRELGIFDLKNEDFSKIDNLSYQDNIFFTP